MTLGEVAQCFWCLAVILLRPDEMALEIKGKPDQIYTILVNVNQLCL